nr:hypothetical protein KXZ65_11285 [Pectobacterium sp. PL152]
MRRLEQRLADATPFSLLVFGLDASAAKQGDMTTLATQLSAVIEEQHEEAGATYLARLDCDEFAFIGKTLESAGQAQDWAQHVMLAINLPFYLRTPSLSGLSAWVSSLLPILDQRRQRCCCHRRVLPCSWRDAIRNAAFIASTRLPEYSQVT